MAFGSKPSHKAIAYHAVIHSDTKSLHPTPRTSASPIKGEQVSRNPPALLWPAAKGAGVRYSVRLSQSPRFPKRNTISEVGLQWAMFNPFRILEPGTWHWQYGVATKGQTRWSETFSFEIGPKTRLFDLPLADDLTKNAQQRSPRLLPTREDVRRIRTDEALSLTQRLYRGTSHLLGQELPDDTTPAPQGDDEYKQMKFARWGSKRLAGAQVTAVESLLCAGLLTGDARFTNEAVRRALNIASWDPDGFTNPVISDFADASCMRAMALVYDSAYDQLSAQQRAKLSDAMAARCSRFFEESVNDVEVKLFGAHLWQHLLTEFYEASLALLGDRPEAPVWCRYIYELWVARFPLIAGDHGGWANGPKYFGTNVETLILMSHYFRQFGATGFDEQPWFRNASRFLRYTWPPGSENDGFGDGTELENTPSTLHLHWVEYLGHRFNDEAGTAYGEAWREHTDVDPLNPRLAVMNLGRSPIRKRHAKPEPKSILFRDTGLVSAHTSRDRIDRNLNVAFRSSPFGSINHMHSCQNAFNILYGGERLFANSGYYIAMADPHAKEWYRHTRGHNTILIDGQGQTRSPEGYGWIPRHIDGDRVTYWLGDASNAYGDAGLVRFRRHVALLHPNIVVIYDDLEADHEATWTWQLHAQNRLTFNKRTRVFASRNAQGCGKITFASSAPFGTEIGDAFDPPAVNWGGKSYKGEKVEDFPKRWHGSVTTEPEAGARFLSIVSVGQKPAEVKQSKDGSYRIGGWRIDAEMEAQTPASLTITRSRDGILLAADRSSVELAGKTYRTPNGTLLIEGERRQRSRDTLPASAIGKHD